MSCRSCVDGQCTGACDSEQNDKKMKGHGKKHKHKKNKEKRKNEKRKKK